MHNLCHSTTTSKYNGVNLHALNGRLTSAKPEITQYNEMYCAANGVIMEKPNYLL